MKQSINELINEYKTTGNTEVLEEILSLVKPLVLKVASSFFTGSSAREDLVQQGYLIAILSIKTYDQSKNMLYYGYLKKCLYYSFIRVIRNREIACLNESNEDGFELLDTVADTGLCVEDEVIRSEENSALYKALDSLPDKQRHVIVERFFNNKSLSQIARDRGVSYMTAVMNQNLALNNLRRAMKKFR